MTEKIQFKPRQGITARQKQIKVFTIDYQSEIDEFRYQGKFTAKKLSIADLAALGVRKTQLNGGMHHDAEHPGHGIDKGTDDFNSMIAHLEIAIVSYPEWWDLSKISDVDLLARVFEEVASHENSFLDSRRERDAAGSLGAVEGSGEVNQEEPGTSRVAGSLVEQEVLASLEP